MLLSDLNLITELPPVRSPIPECSLMQSFIKRHEDFCWDDYIELLDLKFGNLC